MTQSLLWPALSFVKADKGFSCSRLAHSLFHRLKSCSAQRHCKPAHQILSIRHVLHPDSMHAQLPKNDDWDLMVSTVCHNCVHQAIAMPKACGKEHMTGAHQVSQWLAEAMTAYLLAL